MSTIDLSGKGQSSRFNTRERELERRRAKGEASCAECKRLKLKCDRKGPCTSCVRRGCQSICPNGSLAAGQGTRFVLANTDKLHKKLLQMSKRIRQLEDALQIAQATISPASHPLLSDELLSIKNGVDVIVDNETPDSEEHDPTNDVSDAFGTLAISERGEVRFVGRGASEALLMTANEPATEQPSQDRPTEGAKMLPDQIVSASEAFPFTSAYIPREEILRLIEARLPTYARATALAEAYLGNIAWFCRIVRREQLMEELLPEVYKPLRTHNNLHDESSDSEEDYIVGIRSHLLPLLLAVLACGAAGDLTLPLNNDEAEVYVQLARAALSVHSVFWGASTVTVQTVVLLAAYDFCTCRKATPEPAWKMMTFGLSLAASIGLHRDPARWGLGQKIIQRRRFLFWELFHMDKWKSLESGRPATFNLREVDCEFPEDTDATIAEDGSPIPGFWRWKHRFAKEITAPIAEQLCLTRRIKYTEIIELDRKIRDFETHPDMLRPSTSFDVDDDFNVSLRRYMWGLFKEVSLLFIHRNFFARALLERPTSPMSSPFASSVLSAYASAITLLRVVREYFEKYPYLLLRQWIIWAHTLTSGVIIGSIAVRGQASTTAPTALKELNQVIDLFEKAKVHPVVRGGLPVLKRLREKAQLACRFTRATDFQSPISSSPLSLFSPENQQKSAYEELNILGGTARFVNNLGKKRSESMSPPSPVINPMQSSSHPQHRSFGNSPIRSGSLPAPLRQDVGLSQSEMSHNSSTWPSAHHSQITATGISAGSTSIGDMYTRITNPFFRDPSLDGATSTFGGPAMAPGAHNLTSYDTSGPIPAGGFEPDSGAQTQGDPPYSSLDLNSLSWLEGLTRGGTAEHGMNVGAPGINADFLMGGCDVPDPSTFFGSLAEGGDPSIVDAWRSIMEDSQFSGPDVNSNMP